jgi:hypothetical protein
MGAFGGAKSRVRLVGLRGRVRTPAPPEILIRAAVQ